MLKKIVIIGPESTGKTELASTLAQHFGALWLPEYARSYIANLNRKYNYDDVVHIAQKQIELEEEYSLKASNILFFDTDLIITKVWFDVVYGKCPEFLTIFLAKASYDLYLLCSPDIPWVYDPVRENPHMRWYLFHLYEKEIQKYKFNYKVITGIGHERFINALNAVKNILGSG